MKQWSEEIYSLDTILYNLSTLSHPPLGDYFLNMLLEVNINLHLIFLSIRRVLFCTGSETNLPKFLPDAPFRLKMHCRVAAVT